MEIDATLAMVIIVATGLLIGLMAGFFGIGGGTLAVPSQVIAFSSLSMQAAIGTSLCFIFFNTFNNLRHFWKSGRKANKELVIPMGIGMLVGSVLGSKLALMLPSAMIKKGFGVMLVLIVIKTLLIKKNKTEAGAELKPWAPSYDNKNIFLIKAIACGLFGGIISGLTGVGGGVIFVPLLLSIFVIPFREVSLYSNSIMAIGIGSGVLTFLLSTPPVFSPFPAFQVGQVNFCMVLGLLIGSSITNKYGIRATQKVSENMAKILFAALMLLFAMKLIFF